MKMDEMNRYLEDRGFEVERNYRSTLTSYEFTIRRGIDAHTEHFYYPGAASPSVRDKEQRSFLESMVRHFNELHPSGESVSAICTFTTETGHIDFNVAKLIKKVIFNAPATIILWEDGTKTVVKCSENDTYSPEMGMAMAICKKALGNKGSYSKVFKKWLPEEGECIDLSTMLRFINDNLQRALYRVFGATGENCQQVAEKHVRVINDIEHLSGMDLEMLREKLAAGYTLTPPETTKSLVELIAEMEEDDG